LVYYYITSKINGSRATSRKHAIYDERRKPQQLTLLKSAKAWPTRLT